MNKEEKNKNNYTFWIFYSIIVLILFFFLYNYLYPNIRTQFSKGNFRSKYQGKISSRRKTV